MKTSAVVSTMMLILCAASLLTATEAECATGKRNILIAYFSWGGNTRGIAKEIHQRVGGDLFEIEMVKPYSTDYNTCSDQAKKDQENQARPALKNRVANMKKYDVVFIGYPIWWGNIPMPIASFLESYDFSGKTIVPFCSHGGSQLGQSVSAIETICPKSTILEALPIRSSGGGALKSDVAEWLRKIKMGG